MVEHRQCRYYSKCFQEVVRRTHDEKRISIDQSTNNKYKNKLIVKIRFYIDYNLLLNIINNNSKNKNVSNYTQVK